jgi:hypothetical protein
MRSTDRSDWRYLFIRTLLVAVLLTALPCGVAADLPAFTPDSNADRSTIPEIFKWNLSPLFASDEAWDTARLKLLEDIPGLEAYEGELAEPASLKACLDLYFRLHSDANFVTLYANLRQNTAQSDETANAMVQRSLAAMDELMQAAAFIRREVLTLSKTPMARSPGWPSTVPTWTICGAVPTDCCPPRRNACCPCSETICGPRSISTRSRHRSRPLSAHC